MPHLPPTLWFATMDWLDNFSLMQLQLCSLKSGIWMNEDISEHSLRRTYYKQAISHIEPKGLLCSRKSGIWMNEEISEHNLRRTY